MHSVQIGVDALRDLLESGRPVTGTSFGLAHLEASSGDEVAALHASLGDVDEAFRWLDVAVDERATGLLLLRVHPRIDPIRQDPRYQALLRRVGLDAV